MGTRSHAGQHGGAGSAGTSSRRSTHHESAAPSPDSQTFRDLLIFEERLKQSASRLQKRKRKYETLLVLSTTAVLFLSYYVFLSKPNLLILHRLNVALLLFLSTSIFLFFASGMYADRIMAANRFVPQANRSLRNFNMYLNTRTSPRRGILARLFLPFLQSPRRRWSTDPGSRNSSNPSSPTSEQDKLEYPPAPGTLESGSYLQVPTSDGPVARTFTPPPGGAGRRSLSRASSVGGRRAGASAIPLAANPRGELIFNSKVSPAFRDGYERYRSAFERRRSEKLEAKRTKGWRWFLYTGAGWGWWVKEIWKPPELEIPAHAPGSARGAGHQQQAQTQGGQAAVAHGRSSRARSGTIVSIASSASSEGFAEDAGEGSENRRSPPGTPTRRRGADAAASARTGNGRSKRGTTSRSGTDGGAPIGPSDLSRQSSNASPLGSSDHRSGTFGARVGTRSKRDGGRGGRDRERDDIAAVASADLGGGLAGGDTLAESGGRAGRGRDATPTPLASLSHGDWSPVSSVSSSPVSSLPPSPLLPASETLPNEEAEVDRQLQPDSAGGQATASETTSSSTTLVERAPSSAFADPDTSSNSSKSTIRRGDLATKTTAAAADDLPSPKAVAATGDDRQDPVSTLREPESGPA